MSDGVSDGVSGDGGSSSGGGGSGGGGSGSNGDVMVALCGYRVPPAQAHAWAKALLSAVDAEVVVVLTSVVVEPGRSEGWEGARLLATSEAEERGDCLEVREEDRRGTGDLKHVLLGYIPLLRLQKHRATMSFI